jgi:membrane-bound lytic murein transglycosylase MltF
MRAGEPGRQPLRRLLLLPLALAAMSRSPAEAQTILPALSEAQAPALPLPEPWIGDFDQMKQRRLIRILVPFSQTLYFLDKGAERGVSAELGRQLETWINRKYKTRALKIHVAFIPISRDRLLTGLNEGLGDIAAADLTITPARLEIADFSNPGLRDISEVIVTGPSAPGLASLDSLAGKEIHVPRSSSYWSHMQALSDRLKAEGLEEINLRPSDENLEDEDLLEMVNAGLLPFVVTDSYKARIWTKVFPHLRVRDDLVVSTGGEIGWAVRKSSPLLLKEINEFGARYGESSSFLTDVMRRYYGSTTMITNAYSTANQAEYRRVIDIFKKYAGKYRFDYLMVAALGFQESRLRQATRSARGAVGIMQLLPSTAADPQIAIAGIEKSADRNIEAGMKYLRHLMNTYLDDPKIDAKNRTLMAFAAYNAGPGNLARFRRWAAKSNLDPDVWFYNTEEGAARIVGQETVQYVRNIYKYYDAYRLLTEREAETDQARATGFGR